MPTTNVEKSRIVLERLKTAYGFSSDEELGKVFGITKQAVNKRKQRGYFNADEIIRLFPDVNVDWLYSEEIEDLKKLPVRNPALSLEETKVQYAAQVELPESGQLSRDQMRELLGQIESIARILKDSLK